MKSVRPELDRVTAGAEETEREILAARAIAPDGETIAGILIRFRMLPLQVQEKLKKVCGSQDTAFGVCACEAPVWDRGLYAFPERRFRCTECLSEWRAEEKGEAFGRFDPKTYARANGART